MGREGRVIALGSAPWPPATGHRVHVAFGRFWSPCSPDAANSGTSKQATPACLARCRTAVRKDGAVCPQPRAVLFAPGTGPGDLSWLRVPKGPHWAPKSRAASAGASECSHDGSDNRAALQFLRPCVSRGVRQRPSTHVWTGAVAQGRERAMDGCGPKCSPRAGRKRLAVGTP